MFEFVFVDESDIVSELVFTILSFIVPITPDTELVVAVGVESVATFSLFINWLDNQFPPIADIKDVSTKDAGSVIPLLADIDAAIT